MTAAIKGTFPVKQREHNGLEAIADQVNRDRLTRVYVVAVVEWHAHRETANDDVVTFNVAAIEPVCEDDLSDSVETQAVKAMLDRLRKRRGKGSVADTLFSMPKDDDDQLPGQTVIDLDRPVRDGREVPPASGEEVMAERAERAAAPGTTSEADPADSGSQKTRKGAAATKPAPVTFSPGGAPATE